MPDFIRWIVAGISSVAVAVLIFFLATVGIVVAFFIFLAIFLFVSLAMRRGRREMNVNGTRFVWYSNVPPTTSKTSEHDRVQSHEHTASDTVYELSPDDYSEESEKDAQKPKHLS